MALPGQDGGWCSLLLVLLALTNGVRGEVLLIHESGKGTAWGYSHLPSTFPLTWSQARSACEAIPGSMLARVDGWQEEAAVEEYLREAVVTEPVWLANRQTLPEVLEDEQREMNHIGNAGVVGSDLSMGGDVGVTLRCAVYRMGVGLVHELCSEAAVSAALCVQRLSNERPLLQVCPASPHRQWLLVNSHTQTAASQPLQQTTVSVIGLQQCHHHHHHHQRHLARAACRPQGGWELPTCTPAASPSKHQQVKKSRQGYRQLGQGSSSPETLPSLTPTDVYEYNNDYERGLEEKEYLLMSPQQENTRHKRSADSKTTKEVQTSNETPSDIQSATETIPTHRLIVENHKADVDDKVMLYITGYKNPKSGFEKQNHEVQPQHTTRPHTLNEKYDADLRQSGASATHLKDKDKNKAENSQDEIVFDPSINEIETEADSGHYSDTPTEAGQSSVPHHSEKSHLKVNDSAVDYGESEQTSEMHIRTTSMQATTPREGETNEEIKDLKTPSTKDSGMTLKVGTGPINVHGPETQNDKNREGSHPDNTERNFRALIFPDDSTVINSSENPLSPNEKAPAIPSIESSKEGSTSDEAKVTSSKESTTTPSRPIIFPRTEGDDPEKTVNDEALLNDNAKFQTESAAQPTRVSTLSEARSTDVVLDVLSSESTPVAAADPEVSVVNTEMRNNTEENNEMEKAEKPDVAPTTESSPVGVAQQSLAGTENTNNTPDMTNDSHHNNDGRIENDDEQEASEDPDTNTPAPEESTLNPMTLDTTPVNVHHQQESSSHVSTLPSAAPMVTTVKPKTHGTQLLITQILKGIFG